MKKILLSLTLISIITLTGCTEEPKLVCKSDEGNITLYYNDEKITGYTAWNIEYNIDTQNTFIEKSGIDVYLTDFTTWFETNTTGTCEVK